MRYRMTKRQCAWGRLSMHCRRQHYKDNTHMSTEIAEYMKLWYGDDYEMSDDGADTRGGVPAHANGKGKGKAFGWNKKNKMGGSHSLDDDKKCRWFDETNICIKASLLKCASPIQNWIRNEFQETTDIVERICMDPCLPNPCNQNAECEATSSTEYKCNCPRGWTGRHCNEPTCRLEEARVCMFTFTSQILTFDLTHPMGLNLTIVCANLEATLQCIDLHVVDCEAADQLQFIGFKETIVSRIQGYCDIRPDDCGDTAEFIHCVADSGLQSVLDHTVGMESLCWANLNCFFATGNECWQLSLIADILIFTCDIRDIQCNIQKSMTCAASFAAQVQFQLSIDLGDVIGGIIDPNPCTCESPAIPNIGYDFCLGINASLTCVKESTIDCSSTWSSFSMTKIEQITVEAALDTVCSDPCLNNPCQHGRCVADGWAPSCICQIGYEGDFCEIEIHPCNLNGFKACLANLDVVVKSIGSMTCVEIETSLACVSRHSLTCGGFFGLSCMTSYVYIMAASFDMNCGFTIPDLPDVALDVCVSQEITTCLETTVAHFITESVTIFAEDDYDIHQKFSSCGDFLASKDCLQSIATTCLNTDGSIIQTLNMTRTSIQVATDIQCSNCEVEMSQTCMVIMQKAIEAGDFCSTSDSDKAYLIGNMDDVEIPDCRSICAYVNLTEMCIERYLSKCGVDIRRVVHTGWRKIETELGDRCFSTCNPNPCLARGICHVVDETAGEYFCECVDNTRHGQRCEIVTDYFAHFGPIYGDFEIMHSMEKGYLLSRAFTFFDEVYDTIYFSDNGFISFGEKRDIDSFKTFPSHGSTILAPFFADQDLGCGARIFYQVYERNSQNNDREKVMFYFATAAVREHADNVAIKDTFNATVILVVTWYNIQTSPCDVNKMGNTYQLHIVANRDQTFVFYTYDSLNVEVEDAFVGWTSGSYAIITSKYGRELDNFQDVTQDTTDMANLLYWNFLPMNTKPVVTPADECLNWAVETLDMKIDANELPDCPCNYAKSIVDLRYVASTEERHVTSMEYTVDVMSSVDNTIYSYTYQQACNYNLMSGYLNASRPFGASPKVIRVINSDGKNASHLTDEQAFKACCRESTKYCNKYYEVRPIATCKLSEKISIALAWGDPHVITIDRHTYTFNGIGDYTMLKIDNDFEIQARMEPMINVKATIYTGFAVKFDPSTIYAVLLNVDKTELSLYVNGKQVDYKTKLMNVRWVSTSQLMLFSSESRDVDFHIVDIRATDGMLHMTPQFGSRFRRQNPVGLMAATDNDMFSTKTSGIISIYEDDSCAIFEQFGQSWRINGASMFPHPMISEGEGWCGHPCDDTSFTDEELETTCGDSLTCRFDACATRNLTLAGITRQIESVNKNNTMANENQPPQIYGKKRIFARVREEVTFKLTVIDENEGDTWELMEADNYNVNDAHFDKASGVFTWTPTDMSAVDISFVAVDSQGEYSSVFQIELILCSGCFDNGACNYDMVSGHIDQPNFKVSDCECYTGWTGDHCEADENACRNQPCGTGGLCRDVSPSEILRKGHFECLSCGPGLVLNGNRCSIDVPLYPERANTDVAMKTIGMVLFLDNLPWNDDLFNMGTPAAIDLVELLEPQLNHLHVQVESHFHTNIKRFYHGSVAVEQEIILGDLSHSTLTDVARQLQQSTANGIRFGDIVYPVKDTKIITPIGHEVSITNDCEFYVAMEMCQNGGFCVMEDFQPTCMCQNDSDDEFCEMWEEESNLKLIIPLALLAVVIIIVIIIVSVWASRKNKMNKGKKEYQYKEEKDTKSLTGDTATGSDISMGKQHGPRIHSWWPSSSPHAGSHA